MSIEYNDAFLRTLFERSLPVVSDIRWGHHPTRGDDGYINTFTHHNFQSFKRGFMSAIDSEGLKEAFELVKILADLDSEDMGRCFPRKEDCARARAFIAAL